MNSPHALQKEILSLLCFSQEQACIIALKITDAQIFTNPTSKRVAEVALDHIAKYSSPPGVHLEHLLENDLKRGQEGALLRLDIEEYEKIVSNIDPVFVNKQLDDFIESQKLTTAFENSLELLQEGNLEKAKETAYKVISTPTTNSPGILLNNPAEALRFLDRDENNEFFSSAIDLLDNRGVRLDRKTISILIAASGKGKSWWLVAVGKAGMQHHKKVLHITLELSEEKTARRYVQSIFSLTKDQAQQVKVPFFPKDPTGNLVEFHQFMRDSVIAKRSEVYESILDWKSYPHLMIKEFPTSTLSIEQLSLYLDTLKQQRGFVPDILVVDYADLMKIDAASLRIDTGRLYRELRGLAVTRNMALATATQGNRDSEGAKLVTSSNVAEDWSKIGTADMILTYSQTAQEHALGLARIFVAKFRDSQDKFIALVSQNYAIGQFAIDSIGMNTELANYLQNTQ
jgi:replicative DNA helicase